MQRWRWHWYQSQGVETGSEALGLEEHAQLVDLGNLLLGQVASEARGGVDGLEREVIVVALGVEIHGGGVGGNDVQGRRGARGEQKKKKSEEEREEKDGDGRGRSLGWG